MPSCVSPPRSIGFGLRLLLLIAACIGCALMLTQGLSAQTPNDQPTLPTEQESSIRSFPLPPEMAAVVQEQLQKKYPPESGVRMSYDTRTSQLLVFGPPKIHEQVAAMLQTSNSSATPPTAADQPTAATPPQATIARGPKVVPLKNISHEQFEAALIELVGGGNQLLVNVSKERDGEWARYNLASSGGRVSLIVDRKAGQVALEGPVKLADAWAQVVQAIDKPNQKTDSDTRVVPIARSRTEDVSKAISVFQDSGTSQSATSRYGAETGEPKFSRLGQKSTNDKASRMISMIFQPRDEGGSGAPAGQPQVNPGLTPNAPTNQGARPGQQPQSTDSPAPPGGADEASGGGLIGPVQIELLEELGVIVLRGHPRDVERVSQIIAELERISTETQPSIEIYPLQNVSSTAITSIVQQLYDQVLAPRQGRVTITPLVKPNALLLIGRPEAVKGVIDLIKRLDQPVPPQSMFQVFALKHASATAAQQTVSQFFATRTGLGGSALVVADYRTNSLIVQASPRDLEEASALIRKIDVPSSAAVNELRVFPLRNSLADDLAPVLQNAISGQATSGRGQPQQQQFQQQIQQLQQQQLGAGAAGQAGNQAALQSRSTTLRFVTVDGQVTTEGIRSGILTDVRITPDPRANTLIVSAPAESMELIAALIQQLDQLPSAEAQIKVFSIVNGDAQALVQMLNNLFGQRQNQGQGQGGFGGLGLLGGFGGGAEGESVLVPLRFSVDQRTNSIIASGGSNDLAVVEAVLLRLDESDVRARKSMVYRLKNAPAADVSQAINNFLQTERNLQAAFVPTGTINPFEQIEREVIVVPEPVSNSLIVSATPRFFDEIQKLIEQIDARPPMVMIQVLIAEVTLNNTDEFGVEIGLQDSILFDRSAIGDLVTQNITTTDPNGVQTTTQRIISTTRNPGYNFNNQPLGNSGPDSASSRVGTQGLSNFSVGRINNELGFGGFVFSASSENVSVLLRALAECRRLDVLSRPQIMTLDNQPAYIQVGQRVPVITATTVSVAGQTNAVNFVNVGVILGVTPRISPDGLVVMEIDAERSDVGPEAEGIPVSIDPTGSVIRSPRINTTTAQTTISASDAQTVVLGGLITSSKQQFHRRVPYLSNIPILGHLFRYDGVSQRRSELLIIMTPRIVRSERDAELIKQQESSRMSWCLGDVVKMHGPSGLRNRNDDFTDQETVVVYPDLRPDGTMVPMTPSIQGEELLAPPAPEQKPTPSKLQPTQPIDSPTQALPPGVNPPRTPNQSRPIDSPTPMQPQPAFDDRPVPLD